MYELVHSRMVKPWLQVEWLFKLSPYWKDQEEARELIHGFYRNVSYVALTPHFEFCILVALFPLNLNLQV
jgi:hypothetical protein